LSESGFPGFEDLQDRDFVGCVRIENLFMITK